MFTGLVEEVGSIAHIRPMADGRELVITASTVLQDTVPDASIAVQGVCLTVVECSHSSFRVQAVEQTLSKTTLGTLHEGSRVNLERALLPSTRLGGHFVQGHVDATGSVRHITALSASHELRIAFDARYRELVVRTGSICVNGISLTVADVGDDDFLVAIIPHTWQHTTIADLKEGEAVNLEFDILGKYVVSALRASSTGTLESPFKY